LYCIKTSGERSPQGPKSKTINLLNELNEFYYNEYQPLINHEKKTIKKIITCFTLCKKELSSDVQEHFIQHLLRFINKTTDNITKDKKVLYKFKNQLLIKKYEETENIFEFWKQTYLHNILPEHIDKSIHYDVKVKPFDYLKGKFFFFFFYFLFLFFLIIIIINYKVCYI
jgi:hypothetical protein